MRHLIRLVLGLLAVATLCFCGYQTVRYIMQNSASREFNTELQHAVVETRAAKTSETETNQLSSVEETEAAQQETALQETAPIEVDFDALQEKSSDVIAWLYCPDTPINLPVVQAKDNDYYLYRLLDGTPNGSGTLFADYRNDRDFLDGNTVIYGHNMKNGSMFGTLSRYKEQEYYEEHPVMWLLTRDKNYKVELFAGYVTQATSDAYVFAEDGEQIPELGSQAMRQSTFEAEVDIQPGDRILTLSTCSYEFQDARYVLQGKLRLLSTP